MLSKQQAEAMAAFQQWFKSSNRAAIIRLFGYAGTGKTTIAKEIAASVKGTVLFATFTGKAAPLDVEVLKAFFDGTDDRLHWKDKKKFDEFTYGYALTVHKSQGSQWDNVLLFDESNVFNENRWNHLYTGITRAAEHLTIVLP